MQTTPYLGLTIPSSDADPFDELVFVTALLGIDAAVAKVTVSSILGGAPVSPKERDIWVATGVDGLGTRWAFQYNAGSASAFKWEYIGGVRLASQIVVSEATASAAFVDLATVGPTITLPRSGDYSVDFGFTAGGNSGANAQAELFVGGTDVGEGVIVQAVNAAGGLFPAAKSVRIVGRSAGDVLKLKYNVSNGVNTNFNGRWLRVEPVRVI